MKENAKIIWRLIRNVVIPLAFFGSALWAMHEGRYLTVICCSLLLITIMLWGISARFNDAYIWTRKEVLDALDRSEHDQ